MINTLKIIRQSVRCLNAASRHRSNDLLVRKSLVEPTALLRFKYSASTGVKGMKNKKYKIENNTDQDETTNETNEYDVNEEDR